MLLYTLVTTKQIFDSKLNTKFIIKRATLWVFHFCSHCVSITCYEIRKNSRVNRYCRLRSCYYEPNQTSTERSSRRRLCAKLSLALVFLGKFHKISSIRCFRGRKRKDSRGIRLPGKLARFT